MSAKLVKAPVYQQLNDLLRQLIRGGEFKTGERFLTERQIAERFEVSRATANKALSNLVSEGILEFKKGLGTFVQAGALDVDLRLLVSYTARAEAAGKKPETRVLSFKRTTASAIEPDIAARLQVSGGEPLFALERLRLADDTPVILEQRVVVARSCPGLDARAASGSLYRVWTTRFSLAIAGADQVIRAVNLSGPEAELLGGKRGAAALRVTGVGLLEGGEPLWWENTLYRGDLYEFHNRLGPAQSSRRNAGAILALTPGG